MRLDLGLSMPLGIGRKKQGLIQINSAAVHGEAGTGFEKRGKKGAFECANCEYFKNGNACNQDDMKKLSKQPRHPDGSVVVAGEDCCEYVEREK